MKKKLLQLYILLFSGMVLCQVGINTRSPTKSLDVNGEVRVRTLPSGESSDAVVVSDTDGNLRNIPRSDFGLGMGGGADFSTSILGYVPQPVANKVVPATAPGGATVTELGCKQWAENGHHYCAYQLSTGTNFFNTFSLAKLLGGYVVTLPSTAEREWGYANILNSGTGYGLNNNVWIGYNKIAEPGNAVLY